MKPEIESYLREHGDRYTDESLREQLLQAGHAPEDVDAAIRERAAARASAASTGPDERRRFWQLTWGLHVAAWLLLALWVVLQAEGTFRYGEGAIGLIILGVAMLIGVGISGLIGKGSAQRGNLTAALVVPAISAVLLAGSCFGILGGMS
jgi:hypothetical protein